MASRDWHKTAEETALGRRAWRGEGGLDHRVVQGVEVEVDFVADSCSHGVWGVEKTIVPDLDIMDT